MPPVTITPSIEFKHGLTVSADGVLSALAQFNPAAIKNTDQLVIGEGIVRIDCERARPFENWPNLVKVTLPDSLKSIGAGAFMGCPKLQTIVFGSGLQEIGYEAFKGCGSLAKIEVPASCAKVQGGAFRDCRKLSEVTFLSPQVAVGKFAFAGCTELKAVDFAGQCALGTSLFMGCPKLVRLGIKNIPNVELGLSDCPDFEAVVLDKTLVLAAGASAVDATIPDGVETIGPYAFCHCANNLRSVTLPPAVKEIGPAAFLHCTELQTVTFSDGLQTIYDRAFQGCTKLADVDFPETLQAIGDNAFASCMRIRRLRLPPNLAELGKEAFAFCTGLRGSIEVPVTLKCTAGTHFKGVSFARTAEEKEKKPALVKYKD